MTVVCFNTREGVRWFLYGTKEEGAKSKVSIPVWVRGGSLMNTKSKMTITFQYLCGCEVVLLHSGNADGAFRGVSIPVRV